MNGSMRMRALARGFTMAALALALALSACGSGGGSDPGDPPPPPPPPPPGVQTAPEIATQPQSANVAPGQTATFSVVATGSQPLSYQWRRDGVDIAGATTASYTTPALGATDNGSSFTVIVSNGVSSVASSGATLTVTAPAVASSGPRVAAGGRFGVMHSAARSASGRMWAWGANLRGQVGDGTTASRREAFEWSIGSVSSISLGNEMTMVVDSSGTGWWSGSSSNGQNGTSTISDARTPSRVTVQSGIASAAVGNGFTVAALADGTVWGWGNLPTGVRSSTPVQIAGLADITSLCVAEQSIVALAQDGSVWFAGTDRGGAMPGQGRTITSAVPTGLQVPGLTDVTQIACGLGSPTAFGLARRSDGTVYSWGDAGGLGYAVSGFVQLSPQQVPGLTDVTWIAASNTGLTAAFAVTSNGGVLAWGFDVLGSLALGAMSSTTQVVTPTPSALIGDVVEVATSGSHTMFVKRDGSVWAVGSNANGELGNTSASAVGSSLSPVPVTGLTLN